MTYNDTINNDLREYKMQEYSKLSEEIYSKLVQMLSIFFPYITEGKQRLSPSIKISKLNGSIIFVKKIKSKTIPNPKMKKNPIEVTLFCKSGERDCQLEIIGSEIVFSKKAWLFKQKLFKRAWQDLLSVHQRGDSFTLVFMYPYFAILWSIWGMLV